MHTAISKKVVGKSACDNPERYCGWFWKKFWRNGARGHWLCFLVVKRSSKGRFDSYSVRNSVLIISHITFRDCRVHFLPTIFLEIAVCRAQFLSKISSYCPFCDKQLSAAVCINCGSQHHYATVNKYKKFWDHIYTIKKVKEYIPKKVSYNEICCGYCKKK